MRGADLHDAILVSTNLEKVDLSPVDLLNPDGSRTGRQFPVNLQGANLTGANLVGANLRAAKAANAKMTGANLSGATTADMERG